MSIEFLSNGFCVKELFTKIIILKGDTKDGLYRVSLVFVKANTSAYYLLILCNKAEVSGALWHGQTTFFNAIYY